MEPLGADVAGGGIGGLAVAVADLTHAGLWGTFDGARLPVFVVAAHVAVGVAPVELLGRLLALHVMEIRRQDLEEAS